MPELLSNREMFQAVHQSTIPINDGDSKGSAFLLKKSADETIVCTAHHVLKATPSLHDLNPQVNPNLDFALLNDDLGYGPALFHYGSFADLQPGDTVYYGGFPFSAQTVYMHTGIVSAIDEDYFGKRSIKIDGTAVKGMSGGPIFIQKYDAATDSYIPTIIGFLASETFDPVDQFQRALTGLIAQARDLQSIEAHNRQVQEEFASHVRSRTKIERESFYLAELHPVFGKDCAKHFGQIWDRLYKAKIITEDNELNIDADIALENISTVLGKEYAACANSVCLFLRSRQRNMEITPDDISPDELLNAIPEQPTDNLIRVGMTLVNSLSTGIVTGYFIEDALQNLIDFNVSAEQVGPYNELDIGREYDRLFKEAQLENASLSEDAINKQIIERVTQMGGRYGEMLPYVKQKKVESDHFPPKSVYKHAKDAWIRSLSDRNMASLNLPYAVHRSFITTGSSKEAVAFRKVQERLFAKGNYCYAIKINLYQYQEAGIIVNENKQAIVDGLNTHMTNGLINDAQKNDLIKEYNLSNVSSILPQTVWSDNSENNSEISDDKHNVKNPTLGAGANAVGI